MSLCVVILIMAKFQDLEIMESAAYRQRNARSFCGPALSEHQQQHLMSPSVFLTSPDDSSFTIVLSDLPKSNTSTSVPNKPTFQSYVDRHGSPLQPTQPYCTDSSDQNSRTLPHKHHSKLHLDFSSNPENCTNYSTLESRKTHPNKLKSVNNQQSNNLIEFGSPPQSPLRPSTNPQQAYQYASPGKIYIFLYV